MPGDRHTRIVPFCFQRGNPEILEKVNVVCQNGIPDLRFQQREII